MYDKNDGIREYFPRAGEPAKPLRHTLKLGPIHLETRTRSVGGEVDWQGLRRRVRQRAVLSARLSVSLGRDQVDVFFFDCHCRRFWLFLECLGFTRSQISTYRYGIIFEVRVNNVYHVT